MSIELTSKFFYNNKEQLINACICEQINQFGPYQNEDNIERSRRFELSIANISHDLKHVSQDFGGNGKKRDIEHVMYNTAIEVKTTTPQKTKTIWHSPLSINWQKNKNNGVIDEHYINTKIPDGLIVYQKFSEDLGLPAFIGYVDYTRLLNVFRTTLKQTNADVYVTVGMSDFEWTHVEENIPRMSANAYQILTKLRDDYKAAWGVIQDKWFQEHRNGYSQLNLHKTPFRSSKATLAEKSVIKYMYHEQGLSYVDIARSTNLSPGYIKGICQDK